MADKPTKTPPERVLKFRRHHGLDQKGLDKLFGFSSEGRASRRWELEGAPAYVGVLMAYVDQHGLALAQEMAAQREPA